MILKYLSLLFIGLANSVSIPLFGTTLSIYLTEEGFGKKEIAWLSCMNFPRIFKILWSYPIDHIKLPFFEKAPRKGWLSFSLLGIFFSILSLSFLDPSEEILRLALSLVVLSIFTSMLYMVGLSYELEMLEEHEYAKGSFFVNSGYRIGLLVSSAAALSIAHFFGWQLALKFVAFTVLLALITVLFLPEPRYSKKVLQEKKELSASFWRETILAPLLSILSKENFYFLCLVLFSFKLGDQMTRAMNGPFFLSLGFDKKELAFLVKFWGFFMTISGGMLGAFLKPRSIQTLLWMSIVHSVSLLGHFYLSITPKSYTTLVMSVMVENFTAGICMTLFISFLWKQVDKTFASVQYALLWSLFAFKGEVFTLLGGFLAEACPWHYFYLISVVVGSFPALLLLLNRDRALIRGQ